jgi:hypothetical protein
VVAVHGYEIVEGTVRPSPGAEGTLYDPWQEYLESRRRGTGDRRPPPYQDLIALWHDVSARDLDGSYSVLDQEQEALLRGWCREHGLLGLWHHEVLLALFPESRPKVDGGERLRGYERSPWGWREVRPWVRPPSPREPSRGVRLPDEVIARWPRDVWRSTLPSGGFVLRELGTGAVSTVPLDPVWELHFDPQGSLAKPVWPVPPPDSPDFWQAYGEPVATMMFAARELANSIDRLTDRRDTLSRETLNRLASAAAPALVETEDGFTWGWDSPSLLASFATMIISEASGGARPVACQTCGTTFLTKAYQSLYCSPTCKETAHTRRRRSK